MSYVFVRFVLAITVSFVCQVLAAMLFRRHEWDRAVALISSILVLGIIAFATLPGHFTHGSDDFGNGILFMAGVVQAFLYAIVAAVCAATLQGLARRFAAVLITTKRSEN